MCYTFIAIVGYLACDNNKQMTKDVNVLGTQNVVDCMSTNQLLLFGSTGSNYGKVDGIYREEHELYMELLKLKQKILLWTKELV